MYICARVGVQVGEGLADAIAEKIVARDEVFVTSKLWNDSHRSVRGAGCGGEGWGSEMRQAGRN